VTVRKKLRVLALMHDYLVPPDDVSDVDLVTVDWKTEYDVTSTLAELGHEVYPLGVSDDVSVIQRAVDEFRPHIAFNMMEAFREVTAFETNIVAHLELLRLPYTGCNPRGIMLSRDKALSKQLLVYHEIPVPGFAVFKRHRAVRRPPELRFPLIIKSLNEDASIGISQASVVDTDSKMRERVDFIHESIGTDAIAERFIRGRELYVGVVGNTRTRAFPVWEMHFDKMGERMHQIATDRVKWSAPYQQKHGIRTRAAKTLRTGLATELQQVARRVYRALKMSGYARMDFRLNDAGQYFVLEANANPQLAFGEDFAESAEHAGLSYEALLERILREGLRWKPEE